MNAFERMNAVIDYLEANLTGEIDYAKAARIACCPKDQFSRLFSYLTDITLSEYIRRRRLTLSAFELQQGEGAILDLAFKYGYDSHAAFSRAFKEFHGFSPSQARSKSAVFTLFQKVTFQAQNPGKERSGCKVAMLGKIEFLDLPAVRMIGRKVINGAGENPDNPVPALWAKCFEEQAFETLERCSPVVDYYVGWMGEYDPETNTFTYLAGMLLPAGSEAPEGFDYRDLAPCLVGDGYINGSFANGEVFCHAHELTVGGIIENGYEPDYSKGWSAEVYPKDLSFEAEEGTIHYFCPCQKA
ncbi:AraC family transcriptional regulator [Gorillibacterium timonense]|uniref:AraC family transcriptional regulator n=1 Tax=Gorillibacterium timonense TaxID=1689269 RepID=UPI00071CE02B|nr:AraC family transcriptional regulator [Gorillibacterium timonense]